MAKAGQIKETHKVVCVLIFGNERINLLFVSNRGVKGIIDAERPRPDTRDLATYIASISIASVVLYILLVVLALSNQLLLQVRDDINWEFIADQMGTRNRMECMYQW